MYILSRTKKYSILAISKPGKNAIRWGYTGEDPDGYDNIYQPKEAIITASNKPLARRLLIENGISCPEMYDKSQIEFPCIARPKRTKQGKNFFYIENKEQLVNLNKKMTYFQQYIDKEREYRVHVFLNKVLVVQEKLDGDKASLTWNHGNGFIFRPIRWSLIPRGLCPIAITSVQTLGLIFGAVDVIEKDNNFYVLEINTAPSAEGYTLERYRMAFDYLDKHGEKNFEGKKLIIRNEELED